MIEKAGTGDVSGSNEIKVYVDGLVAAGLDEIKSSASVAELDDVRVRYLGKKGALTHKLKELGQLPAAERPAAGQEINRGKRELQAAIEARRDALQDELLEMQLAAEVIDVTLPGRGQPPGGSHPVTRTMTRIEAIFRTAGFDVHTGPEIEDEYHNFEALNIPQGHPGGPCTIHSISRPAICSARTLRPCRSVRCAPMACR